MDLRGASADSVAALSDALKASASGSPAGAATVADGLFEASRTVRQEAALRRFLTDASVPAEAKTGLAKEIFGGKVDDAALGLITAAVSSRWTHGQDLPDALEQLSEEAVVRSAGTDGARLSDELFTVAQVVQSDAGLRDALSDPARSVEDKEALLDQLLAGKALPATAALAKQSVTGTYRTVSAALAQYQKVAGAVHDEGVATVRVATPLSDDQLTRLTAALSKRSGRAVHVNVLVDPAVVGGIKVEIGDDVIDGSIATRLDDARRALAG